MIVSPQDVVLEIVDESAVPEFGFQLQQKLTGDRRLLVELSPVIIDDAEFFDRGNTEHH